MKLWIFDIWQGYVWKDYIPIVAETEEEARKYLYEKIMPAWNDRVYSTAKHIREYYADKPDHYRLAMNLNYGRERKKIFKDSNEEADYYIKEMKWNHEEQIRTCEFVSIDLPILKKGYIEELYHCFME